MIEIGTVTVTVERNLCPRGGLGGVLRQSRHRTVECRGACSACRRSNRGSHFLGDGVPGIGYPARKKLKIGSDGNLASARCRGREGENMTDNSTEKTASELQREIDVDRQRIGDRIEAIQERMSPGQLIDEVLAYAKGALEESM
jgi:hypothetical protein